MKRKSVLYIIIFTLSLAGMLSCSGDAFDQYKKERIAESNIPIPDTTPPYIESISAISGTEAKVVFSEEIDPVTAVLPGNYYVQGNNRVTVTGVVVQGDNRSVILTLSNYSIYRMQNGKEYTLLVQSVADVKGNKILNAFSTFIGKGQVVAGIFNGTSVMPVEVPFPSYNISHVEFTVGGEDISAYQYSLDDSALSSEQPVAAKLFIAGLTEGFHTLRVIGKSSVSGEWQDINQPTVASFTVDVTPPIAMLQHTPPNVTDQAEIDVVVAGNDVSTYRYRLNSGSWSEDVSTSNRITKKGLPEGSYTLYVVGKDIAGNVQSAATEYSWSINASSSVAALINSPAKFTRMRDINIGISGNNVNYFKYRINGAAWTDKYDTGTAISLTDLPDGNYTLDVVGASGQSDDSDGPVTSYSWTIDNIAPACVISNLTSNPTSSQSTHFTVGSAAGDVVSYKYRINNEMLSGICSADTPIEVTSLPEGTFTIKVMGIDSAGNIQSEATASTWTWVVDLSPPHASLSGVPLTNSSTKNITVSVNGAGSAAYRYQLDNLPWSSELSVSLPIEYINLEDGYHTLSVVARDQSGNWQTIQNATYFTWIIDTVPPVATLTDKPSLITNVQTADITVGGSGVARYKYRFDSTTWSIEYDRVNYPSIPLGTPIVLSEGSHTLDVLSVDAAGNWQLIPTSYTWTINASVPTAVLLNAPASLSTSSSVNITVQSVDSYKYKIDSTAWSAEIPAGTHITASGLNEGLHTLLVIGKNSTYGNFQEEGNATYHEWTIDTTAPTAELGNKPPLLTNSQAASFIVSGVGIYSYRYSIDNPGVYGSTVAIASDNTIDFTNLAGSSHTLYVIARDEAGNWQVVPSTYTWNINTTVPVARMTPSTLPSVITKETTIHVTVDSLAGDVVSYKYKYDDSAWSPELNISSTISRVGVTAATHTLSVIGKNSAGTWQLESTPAVYTWTVNLSVPSADDILLSNLPNDPTADTGAAITVSGSSIITYQYKVNNNSWSADIDKSVPITLTGLVDNTYTLYVVAKNAAGNGLDRSLAKEFTWHVDTSSPLATITNRPDNPSSDKSASFRIGGAGIIEYKYKLNNDPWSGWIAVAANINFSSLADGSYKIQVCGKKAGDFTQADINATTYTWVIDSIAPTAVLSNLPADGTTSTSVAINVGGSGVIGYRYRIDSIEWLPSVSDKSVYFPLILNLPVGSHTIEVIGRDEAGNWQAQATPAFYTWTISPLPLVSPVVYDGGTIIATPVIKFGWILPEGTGALKIQIASDSGFSNILNGSNGEVISPASPHSYIVTNTEIQNYYARVSVNENSSAAAGDAGWTTWGVPSDGVKVVGRIGGRVKDFVGLGAIPGAKISVIRMDNSIPVASGETDSNGDFSISDIPIGTGIYRVDITDPSYSGSTQSDISVRIGEEKGLGQIYLLPVTAVPGIITGTSVDANTGFTIGGTTITVIDFNKVEYIYTAAANGVFSTASLDPGSYTVIISLANFYSLTLDNVIVNGNRAIGRQALCEVLQEPQVRFVYQWDAFPIDPDIFMTGPTVKDQADAPVNRFIVQSALKMYNEATGLTWGVTSENGDWYGTSSTTSLVQDAVTGYGPEAINLYRCGGIQYAKGVYTFTVHRWAYNTGNSNTSSVFTLSLPLTDGSKIINGTVAANETPAIPATVTAGSIEIIANVSQGDNLFYGRPSYLVSGNGIPAGTYMTWYDRSETRKFQMNNAATISGTDVEITLSNRIESYGLYPGLSVTGDGIPGGTIIESITNTGGQGFTMVLSKAATATATSTLTFFPGWGRTSGVVRVYDSGGLVDKVVFPANMLSSDTNCWKALKMNIQGNTRSKRSVIPVDQLMQAGVQNKTTMDW